MTYFKITVEMFSNDGHPIKRDEIYTQTIPEQYAKDNPQWLSKVIAVINCLPFPLLTITEPKEK